MIILAAWCRAVQCLVVQPVALTNRKQFEIRQLSFCGGKFVSRIFSVSIVSSTASMIFNNCLAAKGFVKYNESVPSNTIVLIILARALLIEY